MKYATLVLVGLLGLPSFGRGESAGSSLPAFTVIGAESSYHAAELKAVHDHLEATLHYWKSLGAPDLAPMRGMFIIAPESDPTVLEIIKAMNPDAGDVLGDLTRQSEYVKSSPVVAEVIARTGFPEHVVRTILVDTYAMNRFGFRVLDTLEAIRESTRLSQADSYADVQSFDFPYTVRAVDYSLNDENLSPKTMPMPGPDFRNFGAPGWIVYPPRTNTGSTEEKNLNEVSTAADARVAGHELVHKLIATLTQGTSGLPIPIEEIFADYLSLMPGGEAKVGEDFAKMAGTAATIRAARPRVDVTSAIAIVSLRMINDRGYLRTLDDRTTLDGVTRHVSEPDVYEAGAPGRGFLWTVRQALTPEQARDFDRIALDVIKDLANQPSFISSATAERLIVRGRKLNRRIILKSVLRTTIQNNFTNRQKTRELGKISFEILSKDPRFLFASPWQRLQMVNAVMAQVTTPDGYNMNIESVKRNLEGIIRNEANAAFNQDVRDAIFLLRRRPRTVADYVMPEFFRSYYRMTERKHPEFLNLVTQEIARASNAHVVPFTMPDGTHEIALVRRRFALNWAIAKRPIGKILREMHGLKKQISGASDETERERLTARFEGLLERLHEFERTNSAVRLVLPRPLTQIKAAPGQIVRACRSYLAG